MTQPIEIGTICHEYGSLLAKEENGKFYWAIEGNCGTHWEEIPESLYVELLAFQASL
jgi:23S rRNA maturation-related 3'-5' exoribonuclease YhaM